MSIGNVQSVGDFIPGSDFSVDDDFDLGLSTPIVQEPEDPYASIDKPCIILDNVSSEYEVRFLKSRVTEEPVPVYVRLEGVPKRVAKTDLDLKSLIVFRRLGFTATLITPTGKEVNLNEISGDKLLNFIKL